MASKPVCLPDATWRSEVAVRALHNRDFRAIFHLVRINGASPADIAAATGLSEVFVRKVMNGDAVVSEYGEAERIAGAFHMPDKARAALGLVARPASQAHMPAEFWAREDVSRAVAELDIPALLLLIAYERRWTQSKLAEMVGYSQSWISHVIRLDHALTVRQAREIALCFGAPLDRLTLALPGAGQGAEEGKKARRQALRNSFSRARKIAGFTQESLAAEIGVERTTVIRWEKGESEPMPHVRPKLAQTLGISGHELDEMLLMNGNVSSEEIAVGFESESPETTPRLLPARRKPTAAEILRTRIWAERKARHWSARKMAEMLRDAADKPDECPPVYSVIRMLRYWESGAHMPSEMYRLLYCKVFGMAEDELFGANPADGGLSAAVPTPNVVGGEEQPERSPAIAELSAMLTDYGFGLSRFGSSHNGEMPDLGNLERDVRITFDAYQQSRFATAASRVSMLLADAQMAVQACKESERARVLRVLALSYQAAATILAKSGEKDLAWIASERRLNAANDSGSPSVRGSLIRSVAFTLHATGRFESAMRLVDSCAESLYGEIDGNEVMLSVYGTLLLVGSMAAARFGDSSKTADYLRDADSAAQRLGKDGNHLWTSFGPTNVAIHRVNTAVELDDFQTVLNSGLSLNVSAVPVERRVRYLLDVARVYALTGKQDDALGTMLTAERIAPEQVRQHFLSKKVVMTLVRNAPAKPSPELSKLAMRVKVHEPA